MDQKQMEVYRQRLMRKREDVVRDIERTASQGREQEVERAMDRADQSLESHEKDVAFARSGQHRVILEEIDEALLQIDEGAYGTCRACGGAIEPKRLEVQPWATLCLKDQEKQEVRDREENLV
jgi:DnaK suppressor protein